MTPGVGFGGKLVQKAEPAQQVQWHERIVPPGGMPARDLQPGKASDMWCRRCEQYAVMETEYRSPSHCDRCGTRTKYKPKVEE